MEPAPVASARPSAADPGAPEDPEDLDWQWFDPDEVKLREKSRRRYKIAFVVLLLYAALISRTRSTGDLGNLDTFLQQDVFRQELAPDEEKLVERVLTNKETPGFASVMTYEDVARIISMGQRFCMEEQGFNERHRFSHVCDMSVSIEPSVRMTVLGEHDVPVNTSAGNGWGKIGVWELLRRGQSGALLYGLPSKAPTRPAGARCDKDFMMEHFVDGDSPFTVPWGADPPGLRLRKGTQYDDPYVLAFKPGLYDYLERNELIAELPALSKIHDANASAVRALNESIHSQHDGDTARGLPVNKPFGNLDPTPAGLGWEAADSQSAPAQAAPHAAPGEGEGKALVERPPELREPRALVVDAGGVARAARPPAAAHQPGWRRAGSFSQIEGDLLGREDEDAAVQALESSAETTIHALEDLAGSGAAPARLAAVRALERLAEGPHDRPPAGGRPPQAALVDLAAHRKRSRAEHKRARVRIPTVAPEVAEVLPPECFTVAPDRAKAHWAWRQQPEQSRGPEPDAPYKLKKTCSNHHWGYGAVCQPYRINVVFRIWLMNKRGMIKPAKADGHDVLVYDDFRGTKVTRARLTLDFWSVGTMSSQDGSYASTLESMTFVSVGQFEWLEFVLGLLFFTVILTPVFQPLGALRSIPTILRLPWTRRNVASRAEAIELLLNILDPYEHDRAYTTVYAMLLRTLLMWTLVVTIFASLLNFFFVDYLFPDAILTKNSDYCQLHEFTGAAFFWQCRHTFETTGALLGSGLWLSLLHPNCIQYHEVVAVLLFVFCLNIFADYKNTAWVGTTFYKSVAKMNTFLPIFFACVLGFAFMFHVRFGSRFIQFSTFQHSLLSLGLFTFAVPGDTVVEGSDGETPLFDNEASLLQISLLVYGIFVVMLVLNFFTTVVIDSYEQAKDEKYQSVHDENVEHLRDFDFLFPVLVEEQRVRQEKVVERMKAQRG